MMDNTSKLCDKPSTTFKLIAAIFCVLGAVALTNANVHSRSAYLRSDAAADYDLVVWLVVAIGQAGGGIAALVQLFSIMSGEDEELRAAILAGIYAVFNLGAAIFMIIILCKYVDSVNVGCWILLITTIGAAVVYIVDFVLCVIHK